jgi:SAM-dependent methyltransferase
MAHPKWSSVYQKQVDFKELVDHAYSHMPYLEEVINRDPGKVLEVGAGGGSTSIFLTYLGIKVLAVDNDPQVIVSAKQNNDQLRGKLELQEADAFKLPFPDNSFDIVCHQGFFEHFEDGEIVKLAREQLRVAPLVVFSVPTIFYLSRSLGERLMTKKRWDAIFHDINIVKSFYYGRPRNDALVKRFLSGMGWKNIYYCCLLGRK